MSDKNIACLYHDDKMHRFIMPVEWENRIEDYGVSANGAVLPVILGKKVTKLRCVCGQEQTQ